MSISRNGDTFVVAAKNPEGLLNGQFAGTLTPAGIKVNAGIAGEQIITYAKDSETLSFAGETFSRVSGSSSNATNESWVDESGLTWTTRDNGAWVTLAASEQYCANLTLGGWSDWRLPTIAELKTLYDPALHGGKEAKPDGPPAIRPPVKLTKPGLFSDKKQPQVWSGTPLEGLRPMGRSAFVFNFANGYGDMAVGSVDETGAATVLCVRR